jgi:hypothetical protein
MSKVLTEKAAHVNLAAMTGAGPASSTLGPER